MAAQGKGQVKLYLRPESHETLQRAKRLKGQSMSVIVDELVEEVLKGELDELEREESS